MTFDAAISDAVATAIQPLAQQIAHLQSTIDRLAQVQPPQFVSPARAAEILQCHPLTVLRKFHAGELAGRRCGRKVLIDAAALRPADNLAVAKLARAARAT